MVLTADVLVSEGAEISSAPRWVVFTCDGFDFGILLDRARQILPPRDFTRIPGCGADVCGLIGVRGRAVTVFDLGAALGLRPARFASDHRILLIDREDKVFGFVVERVVAVASAERQQGAGDDVLRPHPVGDEIDGWCLGEEGERFLTIDPDLLLARLLS